MKRFDITSFAWLYAVILGLYMCHGVQAQDAAGNDNLQASLEEVQGRIMKAREEAEKWNHAFLRAKDRIVYSNDAVNVLYKEAKELEKKLNEKRKLVDDEMMKVPEIREMLKARDDAFAAVRKIKDEEAAILQEIKTRETRAAFQKKQGGDSGKK